MPEHQPFEAANPWRYEYTTENYAILPNGMRFERRLVTVSWGQRAALITSQVCFRSICQAHGLISSD